MGFYSRLKSLFISTGVAVIVFFVFSEIYKRTTVVMDAEIFGFPFQFMGRGTFCPPGSSRDCSLHYYWFEFVADIIVWFGVVSIILAIIKKIRNKLQSW